MRRWIAISTAAVGIAALAGAGVWYFGRPTLRRSEDEAWTAIVGVLAGDGIARFKDGPMHAARFAEPFGIAASPDGTIVVADAGDAQRIRRIDVSGTVTTIAGGFNTPSGVAIGSGGTIYVADTGSNAIRTIAADGTVATLSGGHHAGFRDGDVGEARFNGPIGVAVTPSGEVVVADTYNDRIRVISTDGTVRTLAGGANGYADGPANSARFDTPCGIGVDRAGNVYVADTGNNLIRFVAPSGLVTTVRPLPSTGLFRPIAVAIDDAGTVYVTEESGQIVEIKPAVSARVIAGSGVGFANGRASEAKFRAPSGIAVLGPGRLVVTDRRNALVRVVEDPKRSPLRPPASPTIQPQFDFASFAQTPLLWPVFPQDGPFEITGTLGEMRGGEGGERFHAGLDIHADEGTLVRAIRDGVVSDPVATSAFNTLNEAVRIGPLVYVHQRVGRTRSQVFDDPRLAPIYDDAGKMTRMRVKRGARYEVGEAIGTTNAFNHVHLNIGWPLEEINPLATRLVQFIDTVQPTIAARGIHLVDENGTELKARARGRLLVSGRVHIVVDAWDQVDGNRQDRRLGLYRLGYQVLQANGQATPGFEQMKETLRFDRLFPDGDAARVAYAPGSGIPFFGRRRTRFLYDVTNELRGGVARPGVWDTTTLPDGDYVVRILATDISGNVAIGNRDLLVTVQSPGSGH